MSKRILLALSVLALWSLPLILVWGFVGNCEAQETYSISIQWERVAMTASFFYQIGACTEPDAYTPAKDIFIDVIHWDTATIDVPDAGPWYVAIRTCLPRGGGDPLCSTVWRPVRARKGSPHLGPHYPLGVVIVDVPDAWMVGPE